MRNDDGPLKSRSDDATEILQRPPEARALGDAEDQTSFLTVLAGSPIGKVYQLSETMVIGRDPDVDIHVSDEGVSRRHAELVVQDNGAVVLSDLGSRNGTEVNGEPTHRVTLIDGDRIQVGSATVLKFSHGDPLEQSFQQRLYDAAVRDGLTGVHNRRFMLERLEAEYRFSLRHGGPLSVLMFDVDHFKQVNDQHGHGIGDAVLSAVASKLGESIRAEDLLARYGGEEFILICRALDRERAVALAERLRQLVAQSPLLPELPDLRVTVSCGVATVPHAKIAGKEQLLASADQALYAAKHAGRNRVCVLP